MSAFKKAPTVRYRFDRRGNVVVDERRLSVFVQTGEYMKGDPIFARRRSSAARLEFRAARVAARAAARAA